MSSAWRERWRRVKGQLTEADVALSLLGTTFVAVGVGALCLTRFSALATASIVMGAVVVLLIKWKYWTRFWGGP